MSNKLSLLVNFLGVDKLSGTLRGISGASKGSAGAIRQTQQEALRLKGTLGDTAAFRRASEALADKRQKTIAARQELANLRSQIVKGQAPTKQLTKQIQAAETRLGRMEQAERKAGDQAKRMAGQLRGAGVDVTRLSTAEKQLTAQLDAANRKLERQQQIMARAEGITAFGNKVAGVGRKLNFALTLPLMAAGAASIKAGRENMAAYAQVQAGLASMGNASGRTEAQLRAQATGLMRNSLYAEADILRRVTANMLTFGNVSGAQFDRAQQAALDLSTRMEGDLKGATLQVGKALNDPVRGMSALGKAGIQFNDEQRAMIQGMVAAGNVAGAQNIILGELEKQFKGSAKAAMEADPYANMTKNIGELQGAIGEKLLPMITPAVTKVTELINRFGDLSPEMQKAAIGGGIFLAALGPMLSVGGNVIKLAGGLYKGIALAGKVGPIAAKGFMVLRTASMFLASGMIKAGAMMLANPMILAIVALVAVVGFAGYMIYKHWDKIKAAFMAGVEWIGDAMGSIKDRLIGAFTFWAGLHIRAAQIGGQIIQGLARGIINAGSAVWEALKKVVTGGIDRVKNFLGIKSPSRVFMLLGDQTMQGMERGITRGGRRPMQALGRLSTGLTAAGAMALTPVAAAASAGQAGGAGPVGGGNSYTFTFNITQQPGENAEAFARRIKEMIEKLMQEQARGSYEDQD